MNHRPHPHSPRDTSSSSDASDAAPRSFRDVCDRIAVLEADGDRAPTSTDLVMRRFSRRLPQDDAGLREARAKAREHLDALEVERAAG